MNTAKTLSCIWMLSAAFVPSAFGGVPTAVMVEGHVTNIDSRSVEIDGKSYPIEAGSDAAHDLASVQRGDAVSIAISPKRVPGSISASNTVSAGRVVVHAATDKPKTTVKVIHAPGVR